MTKHFLRTFCCTENGKKQEEHPHASNASPFILLEGEKYVMMGSLGLEELHFIGLQCRKPKSGGCVHHQSVLVFQKKLLQQHGPCLIHNKVFYVDPC